MKKHIVRQSSQIFTETEIDNSMFQHETGITAFDGSQTKTQRFTIEKKYGAGLHISMVKFNKKRIAEFSTEIGLVEIEMLIEFLNSIKSQCRNYSGEIKILPVS